MFQNEKTHPVQSKKEETRTLKKDNPHQTPFMFRATEEGQYMVCVSIVCKEKSFINSGQTVSERKPEKASHKFNITKMLNIVERVIYHD